MQTSFWAEPLLAEPLKLNYRELIHKKLEHIPADYLAYLYQVVSLMAKNYEPERVSREEILAYIDAFKKSFGLIMKQNQHFHVAYQEARNCIWLCWTSVDKDLVQEDVPICALDFERIAEENETDLPTLTTNAQDETQILFTDEDIVFCKAILPVKWTVDRAQADARLLFGVFMQYLPTYKADEKHSTED